MNNYRLCGKVRGARKNSQFDHSALDDKAATTWAADHCRRHPMFMPSHLVEVIAVGEYRTIPFGLE